MVGECTSDISEWIRYHLGRSRNKTELAGTGGTVSVWNVMASSTTLVMTLIQIGSLSRKDRQLAGSG